jgi:hypothetical protein
VGGGPTHAIGFLSPSVARRRALTLFPPAGPPPLQLELHLLSHRHRRRLPLTFLHLG